MNRKNLSDYKQMQSLGEWLEKFLDPDLTFRELETLIFDAVRLIDLDFGPLISDKLLVALRSREPDSPIWPDLEHIVGAKGPDVKRINELFPDTEEAVKEDLRNVVSAKYFSLIILQKILEARFPFIDYLDNGTKEKFKILSDWHSWVGDVVEIGGDAFRPRRTVIVKNSSEKPDTFPLHLIFARIFVDFLVLGGWDYYGFCKHCGKFFMVQRKGRKQFCSDSCRFQFHYLSKKTQR